MSIIEFGIMCIAFILPCALVVINNKKALTFTEKKSRASIVTPVRALVIIVFWISFFNFTRLVVIGEFQLNELIINNEADAVEFSNSRSNFATLNTGQFYDSGYTISKTSSRGLGLFFGSFYAEIPIGTENQGETYHVFFIELDSKLALYLEREEQSSWRFNSWLSVQKADTSLQTYCYTSLARKLAADLDVDEEHFYELLLPVALQPTTSANARIRAVYTGVICLLLVIICAFLTFVLPKLARFKMHSKFGKQISRREELSIIEKKINAQVKTPVFKNDFIFITQDYIIGNSKYVKSGFWYIDQLVLVEIEEDVVFDDGDVRYTVSLFTNDDEFIFQTFDIDSIEDIQARVYERNGDTPGGGFFF